MLNLCRSIVLAIVLSCLFVSTSTASNFPSQAIVAAETGDLGLAIRRAEEALAIPYATNFGAAQDLLELLIIATDPYYLIEVLVQIPEKDFIELKYLKDLESSIMTLLGLQKVVLDFILRKQ